MSTTTTTSEAGATAADDKADDELLLVARRMLSSVSSHTDIMRVAAEVEVDYRNALNALCLARRNVKRQQEARQAFTVVAKDLVSAMPEYGSSDLFASGQECYITVGDGSTDMLAVVDGYDTKTGMYTCRSGVDTFQRKAENMRLAFDVRKYWALHPIKTTADAPLTPEGHFRVIDDECSS